MNEQAYVGHSSQLTSVEEVRLVGGKGDGMRLLQIRNASGMELTLSVDRCADISRLIFKGQSMGYFGPVGYVAPAYYDDQGAGFLKSFTAGFLTTSGLVAVGSPCEDQGEALPLHGTIANTPCERIWWTEDETSIHIHARINDSWDFGRKLVMDREIICQRNENVLTIRDTVENCGDVESPLMLMYHMNVGYPLLSEKAVLDIPSVKVAPRNDHAARDIDKWAEILPPTKGYEEQCYYHNFAKEGRATIYNPEINKGLTISFDPEELDQFVQWKMTGYRDYVMGLEPANCTPDGRDIVRKKGTLKFIAPGERKTYEVTVTLFEK